MTSNVFKSYFTHEHDLSLQQLRCDKSFEMLTQPSQNKRSHWTFIVKTFCRGFFTSHDRKSSKPLLNGVITLVRLWQL